MPKEIMPHRQSIEQVKSIGEPRKVLYIKADDLSPEELSALVIQFQNMAPGRVEAWSPEIPSASTTDEAEVIVDGEVKTFRPSETEPFTEEGALHNIDAVLHAHGDETAAPVPMEAGPSTNQELVNVHAAVDGIGKEAAAGYAAEKIAETMSNLWVKLTVDAGFMRWNFGLSPLIPEDDIKFAVADFHTKLDALNAQCADKLAVDSETESPEPPQAAWPFPGEAESVSPDFSATGLPIPNDFQTALKVLINQHSIENHLGMPDHIIADLVCTQLTALAQAVWRTEQWKR